MNFAIFSNLKHAVFKLLLIKVFHCAHLWFLFFIKLSTFPDLKMIQFLYLNN